MTFKDFFDLEQFIFQIPISWNEKPEIYGKACGIILNDGYKETLEVDLFYKNSLLDNDDNNLYEQYVEKNFFSKLYDIIQSNSLSRSIPPVISLYEDKEGTRHIIYDLNAYIYPHVNGVNITETPKELSYYIEDNGKLIAEFKKFLEKELKAWLDVEKNGEQSKFYDSAMQVFDLNYAGIKSRFGADFSCRKFIEAKIVGLQKMCFATKKLNNVFKNEIDFQELMNCFDYDKMCLTICYSALVQGVNSNNEITSAMHYCVEYFKRLVEYQEHDPNYNPIITVYEQDTGNDLKISAKELYQRYERILGEHPEYKALSFDLDDSNIVRFLEFIDKGEHPVSNAKDFSKLIRAFLTEENYEKVSKDEIKQNIENLNALSDGEVSAEKKNRIRQQIEKMEFLLNNNPLDCIRGKGTFSNYYGYIYPNGYVVFDTLDKDFNKSYGNAMFAMPVHLMESLSDIGKKELRTNHKDKIIPIVHRGNWKEKITEILNTRNIPGFSYYNSNTTDVSEIFDASDLSKLREIESRIAASKDTEERKQLEKTLKSTEKRLKLKNIDKELRNKEFTSEEEYTEEAQKELDRKIQAGELTSEEIAECKREIDYQKRSMELQDEILSEQRDAMSIEKILSSKSSFEDSYIKDKSEGKNKKNSHNKDVTATTKRRAKNGDGYCCEWCGYTSIEQSGVHCHHIKPLGKGGIDNIYNTASLCANCHGYFHSEYLSPKDNFNLLMKTKKHIEEESPEYLPQVNDLVNELFSQEDQKFYTDEWNDINAPKKSSI